MPTHSSEIASSGRKRSRSPSDSDTHKPAKRQKGRTSPGAAPAAGDRSVDVVMANPKDSNASASTGSTDVDKSRDSLPAKPEPANNEDSSNGSTNTAPIASILMRCLIVTQDASIIIGKGGAHVNEIREKSGAKVMVSESIPGNPERILNVSGALDAVSKVGSLLRYCILRSLKPLTGIWLNCPPH